MFERWLPKGEPATAAKWVIIGTLLPIVARLIQRWLNRSPSYEELEWQAQTVRDDHTMTQTEKENRLFEITMQQRDKTFH